jgi:hypothetical protein
MLISTRLRPALAGACAALAFAGCGGADGDDGVASLDQGAGQAAATATPAAGDDEANRLRWSECMREHGVQLGDPRDGGAPSALAGELGVSAATLEQAEQACRQYASAAAGDRPNAADPGLLDRYVAFARCMREHGVDMADPEPDASGNVTLPADVDRSTPEYAEGERACAQHLPGGSKGGGGQKGGGDA